MSPETAWAVARSFVTTNGRRLLTPIDASGFGSVSQVTPVGVPPASNSTTPWSRLPPPAENTSPYEVGKANIANTTFDSSGETAIEQKGFPGLGWAGRVQAPSAPVGDTSSPSSPQA